METTLTLKWTYDLLDLKKYLKEKNIDMSDYDMLYDIISDYFTLTLGNRIALFDNYGIEIEKIVQFFQISIDNE